MAHFIIRNLDNAVKVKLQLRARRHRRSLQEEVREILCSAAQEEEIPGGLGTEIAALFSRVGLTADITELRGHNVTPATWAVYTE